MNFVGDPAHSNRQGHERRRVKRLLQLAGAALIAVLFSVDSEAAPILILAGDSNSSTFSNCTGCGGGSTATSLALSSFTLNITTPFPFDVTANTTGVPLAELEMITGNNPSGSAAFAYNLVLTFTTPSGNLSDLIPLVMTSTGNGANSSETLTGFPSLPDFSLPGVMLSNFAFVTAGGTAGSNSFSNGMWTVTRGPGGPGSTAFLDLEANVTAVAPAVPEPNSLAVLGAALGALVGFGLVRRRLDRNPCYYVT
jgi:hypothetical protein